MYFHSINFTNNTFLKELKFQKKNASNIFLYEANKIPAILYLKEINFLDKIKFQY